MRSALCGEDDERRAMLTNVLDAVPHWNLCEDTSTLRPHVTAIGDPDSLDVRDARHPSTEDTKPKDAEDDRDDGASSALPDADCAAGEEDAAGEDDGAHEELRCFDCRLAVDLVRRVAEEVECDHICPPARGQGFSFHRGGRP